MPKLKKVLLWALAVTITIGAMIFQRVTGPTYPARATVTINGTTYSLQLKRSQTNTRACKIDLSLPESISGDLFYRRYPGNEAWSKVSMQHSGGFLTAELPSQPAAGKLQYYVSLYDNNNNVYTLGREKPVTIRFKGDVPAAVLIPHILAMILAMLLSSLAGLFAVFGIEGYRKYARMTLLWLLIGGFILGPMVQYFAFGDFWTGIPFGWDLTDNKTLIATAFWLTAVILNRRKESKQWIIVAAIVLIIVYSIPHSLFGSQLDYSSNAVTQGIAKNL